ncbi:protein polyglycylase ttll10 [Plakobranchus ocellatus]|uniref:Protein polyglycylase ttll10 n=1 Tax=Plakobranchus ocellatus TaxID=259542 RepID=A0AAV4BNN1_9GAST|nr:protein polyglycylase ttll10 [Plakobranchus ocellatus]
MAPFDIFSARGKEEDSNPPILTMIRKTGQAESWVKWNYDPAKRQLPTCTNAFTLAVDPCQTGPQTFYPVPQDQTKFVQCDSLRQAYVVQCPAGQVYNPTNTACQAATTVVNPGNPVVVATTAAPVVTPANPCTAQAVAAGQVFFAFPGDNTRFYQCTSVGVAQTLQCPSNLIWDQARRSCVLAQGTTGGGGQTSLTQSVTNPCTQQQLAAQNQFFPHPDVTKFIQCDLLGNPTVITCPAGLQWDQSKLTCEYPVNIGIGRR